jgi:hypothetical protein
MGEGIPNIFIRTPAPVEAEPPAEAPTPPVEDDVAPDTEAASGAASLVEPLPDLSPRSVRMANGGVVRGRVVDAIALDGEGYL